MKIQITKENVAQIESFFKGKVFFCEMWDEDSDGSIKIDGSGLPFTIGDWIIGTPEDWDIVEQEK